MVPAEKAAPGRVSVHHTFMSNELAPGFLIAVPQLLDPNFRQSVVLLLKQDHEGAMGVVINRESPLLLEELCRDHDISYSGKPDKKVYAITDLGRASLAEAIDVLPRPDKFKSEFLFQMLLAQALSGEQLARVYDTRLDDLTEELGRIQACQTAAASDFGLRFVNGYGQAIVGAAVKYLEERRPEMLKEAAVRAANAAELAASS